jgi:hypothetical protein
MARYELASATRRMTSLSSHPRAPLVRLRRDTWEAGIAVVPTAVHKAFLEGGRP